MRTIICFDVSDDRARYRVVKVLLEHANRVQKSVFECPDLKPAQYLRLRSRLEGLIDHETDSLRYYRICQTCADKIEHAGVGPGQLLAQDTFDFFD
jgi:CRISPR-associated protein Cas2